MHGNPHLILQGASEEIALCLVTQPVRGLPDIFLVLNMLGSLCFSPAQCLVCVPAGRKVCKDSGQGQYFYFYYCKTASVLSY